MLVHFFNLFAGVYIPYAKCFVRAGRDEGRPISGPLEVKDGVLVAPQDHEVLAVTMHVPEKDVLVVGPGGDDSTGWVKLHAINGALVARKKHDRGLQAGGALVSSGPHWLEQLHAGSWGRKSQRVVTGGS